MTYKCDEGFEAYYREFGIKSDQQAAAHHYAMASMYRDEATRLHAAGLTMSAQVSEAYAIFNQETAAVLSKKSRLVLFGE